MTRPPREELKATLLALARLSAPKPLLIGVGAVHLGWWATLNETEALLDELVLDGALRRATKTECSSYSVRYGFLPV